MSRKLPVCVFLCIIFLMPSIIVAQQLNETRISVTIQKGPLGQAVKEVERVAAINFAYDPRLMENHSVEGVKFANERIDVILQKLLWPNGLVFQLVNNIIVIRKKEADQATPVPKTPPVAGIQVTGTVMDELDNPLPGASIKAKATGRATATNEKGYFTILLPSPDVLEFAYMGFHTQEVTVSKEISLKLNLKANATALEQVTITALGIKRSERSVGYAISEVKGEDLQKNKDVNVVNSLAGRVPGLIIDQTASGPSGSTRVLLRGYTEMTGNNQPLFVVDGVPLDNTNFGSAGQFGGYDLGDGISSINPDDIESVSVLKGPAASALYGSRAGHGVILITTKKASKSRNALGIELNSTNTMDIQSTQKDELQFVYGQGGEGRVSAMDNRHTNNINWGAKLDPGIMFLHFDGVERPYIPIQDNIDGFYRTGMTFNNTVVLNSANEVNTLRFTYNDLRNMDIVPNTDLNRNTFNIRGTTKVGKDFDVDVKINYVNEFVKNRPSLGGFRTSVGSNLMTLATTFDQEWLRNNYKDEQGDYYNWNNRDPFNLNPYWIINEMLNESHKERIMSSALMKYSFNNHLNVQVTGGTDFNYFRFFDFAPPSTPGRETGYLQERDYRNKTWNLELLTSYTRKFKDMDLGVRVGGNIFNVNNATELLTGVDMKQRDLRAMASFDTQTIDQIMYRKQISSVFGMFNIGYKQYLFFDATVRTDKASSLTNIDGSSSNNVYTYPSFSGSFVFSEFFKGALKDVLPFGKVRASWARVGSDTDPYLLSLTYNLYNKTYPGYPVAHIDNLIAPNAGLKPTITNSSEFGFDTKFLKDRIGLNFTYYTQTSTDQILKKASSPASGYSVALINAGKIQNKGIEVALNTRPIERENLSWDLNLNFSRNRNKVVELDGTGTDFELEAARWADVRIAAVEGENYGSIMGRDYQYSPSGEILIDGATGLPLFNSTFSVLGNASWDWTGGLYTRFGYKNLSLSMLFDIKIGADLYSMTSRSDYMTGKREETLEGRDEWHHSEELRERSGQTPGAWVPTGGYVANGVVRSVDADGNVSYIPNTHIVSPQVYWNYIGSQTPIPFIYDNSYTKIREIALSYALPKKMVSKFAESFTISIVARNPLILYSNVPNIDPESTYNNGAGMGLEYGSIPTRRSFGLNLNVKF